MSDPGAIRAAAAGAREPPPKPGFLQRIWRWLCRTPVRTFVIYPLVVIAFELIWYEGTLTFMPWGVLLMIWGYLQYRIVGSYRRRHGGGGPGIDVPPQRLLTEGPYGLTRNPIYVGHLIFLAGLALTFLSWLALFIFLASAAWFHLRVLRDENNLSKQFGAPYNDYRSRVKRWIPGVI